MPLATTRGDRPSSARGARDAGLAARRGRDRDSRGARCGDVDEHPPAPRGGTRAGQVRALRRAAPVRPGRRDRPRCSSVARRRTVARAGRTSTRSGPEPSPAVVAAPSSTRRRGAAVEPPSPAVVALRPDMPWARGSARRGESGPPQVPIVPPGSEDPGPVTCPLGAWFRAARRSPGRRVASPSAIYDCCEPRYRRPRAVCKIQ